MDARCRCSGEGKIKLEGEREKGKRGALGGEGGDTLDHDDDERAWSCRGCRELGVLVAYEIRRSMTNRSRENAPSEWSARGRSQREGSGKGRKRVSHLDIVWPTRPGWWCSRPSRPLLLRVVDEARGLSALSLLTKHEGRRVEGEAKVGGEGETT